MTGSYRRQLGLTAASWLIWELAAVAQVKAVNGSLAMLAVTLSLTLPLIGFASNHWYVEQKCVRRRFGLTLAGAIGAAVGTWIVMQVWGN